MTAERIGRHITGGPEPEDERADRERRDTLREALSFWPTGVSILAVREAGAVHALTVGSFIPVSLDPPLILASLGPNAAALPYLDLGTRFVISILDDTQKGLASRFADSFPVGPPPFPDEGDPRVAGCIAALTCEVDELLVRGDHTLVIGRVIHSDAGDRRSALAYFRRSYHGLTPDSRLDR
jgi:flavin reductase (DIM6/NTAB) family NADH-FMN oxidoreductase RutF